MNIKSKIKLVFMLVSVVPMAITQFFAFYSLRTSLTNQLYKEEHFVVQREIDRVHNFIDEFTHDVEALSKYSPIQGIIRAQNSGFDSQDNSSLDEWKQRLNQIFVSYIETETVVSQVRYISEEGAEIARVNKNENGVEIVSKEKLADKSERYYYKDILKMEFDDIYISPIDLNVENGSIETPYNPVVRIAKRIKNENTGQSEGFLIINISVRKFFSIYYKNNLDRELFLIDKDGQYLVHKNQELEFGTLLGNENNYFVNEPEVKNNLEKYDEFEFNDKESSEFRIWKKIFYDKKDTTKYWVLISQTKSQTFFSTLNNAITIELTAAFSILVLTLIISFLVSDSITKPITTLTQSIINYKETGNLNLKGLSEQKDEIGILSKEYSELVSLLKQKVEESRDLVSKQTQELQSKVSELETLNKVMVNRELKMIELKKQIKDEDK